MAILGKTGEGVQTEKRANCRYIDDSALQLCGGEWQCGRKLPGRTMSAAVFLFFVFKSVFASVNVEALETQNIIKYVSADKVVQIEWTTAVEGEDAATEGSSPANAAETQTLTLLPAKGISRVPAGTYRVTICWKCNDVLIAERVIPFFVTR